MLIAHARSTPAVSFLGLDTDVEERLAGQLQIKSLPTLLAVFQGKLLEPPLVGLPTAAALSDFVARVAKAGAAAAGEADQQAEYASAMAEGEARLAHLAPPPAGAVAEPDAEALMLFSAALHVASTDSQRHGALGGMALTALAAGRGDEAASATDSITADKKWELAAHPLARRAVAAVELHRALTALVEAPAADPNAPFVQAARAAHAGQLDAAVATLLALLRADKTHADAKALLFRIFAADPKSSRTIAGRRALAQTLFI